jgi:hypothetical protein
MLGAVTTTHIRDFNGNRICGADAGRWVGPGGAALATCKKCREFFPAAQASMSKREQRRAGFLRSKKKKPVPVDPLAEARSGPEALGWLVLGVLGYAWATVGAVIALVIIAFALIVLSGEPL